MKRIVSLFACLWFFSASIGMSEGQSYVFYDVSKHDMIRFQYFVFDRSGHVLYDGYENNNPPKAQLISSDILELKYLHGNADYRRYFNISTNQVSPTYSQVVTASPEYVLYTFLEENSWSWYIVVASLFDGAVQQQEPIDLGTETGRVESATWNNDYTECIIDYLSNDDYSKCRLTLSLCKTTAPE